MNQFRIGLLGEFEVERAGEPIPFPRGQQRALLATLAVRSGVFVPTREIAERLWDGVPPAGAATTIRGYIKRLRRLLDRDAGDAGRSLIRSLRQGYRLDIAPENVDLHRFRTLTARAAAADDQHDEAMLLNQALGLWRGAPMSDVSCESLHREIVPVLREQRLQALHRHIDLDIGRGEYGKAAAQLRGLVVEHPTREGFWAQLMTALHCAGRTAEALGCFAQCRDTLANRLGVEPGPLLRELHHRMLTMDGEPPILPGQAGHTTPVVPRQLPAAVPGFVGRRQELDLLDELGRSGEREPRVLVVGGAAGVGKTALAVHWAHAARASLPDGDLYVDLRGYGKDEPLDPGEALETLLLGLRVPRPQLPADTNGRGALLRSALAGKRALLVLDNARSAEQVRPLLPGGANTVIVTSRNQLRGLTARDGAKRLRLGRLAAGDAVVLFGDLVGRTCMDAEPEAATEIVRSCSYLPLALRVAAEHRTHCPGLTLAELAARLRDEQTRLEILTGNEDATDLSTVLSWSYRALPHAAARMLVLLSRSGESEITVETAAGLLRSSAREARRLLERLAEEHLAEQLAPGLFELDELCRAGAYQPGAAAVPCVPVTTPEPRETNDGATAECES